MNLPSEKRPVSKYELHEKNTYKSITAKERLKGRAENYWQMNAQAKFEDDRRIGFFAAKEVLNDL